MAAGTVFRLRCRENSLDLDINTPIKKPAFKRRAFSIIAVSGELRGDSVNGDFAGNITAMQSERGGNGGCSLQILAAITACIITA